MQFDNKPVNEGMCVVWTEPHLITSCLVSSCLHALSLGFIFQCELHVRPVNLSDKDDRK